MIVVVLGMSKSGTTLLAKTLHESGINMSPGKTGNYKKSKYEDPFIINILLKMFNIDHLKSLHIPKKIIFNKQIKQQLIKYFALKKGDWGFKQPWVTLCYNLFRQLLPINHIVIGIKRSYKGLLSHWKKRGKVVNEEKVFVVQQIYNALMESYDIPVVDFENFLKEGPGKLEEIIGRKLKDVRE